MRIQVLRIAYILLIATLFLTGCNVNNGAASGRYKPTDSSTNKSIAATSGLTDAAASTDGKKGLGKVLVIYYSFQGNTRGVASIIKEKTGGDVFEIQPEYNYYRADVEEIAKKQIKEGYKPKLKNSVSNIQDYDTIFVGSPVWWFSVSPPVMSFLSQYDFKGKNVVPFCTCVSNEGDFFKQFENAAQNAKILKGRDFKSPLLKDKEKLNESIDAWLDQIKKES